LCALEGAKSLTGKEGCGIIRIALEADLERGARRSEADLAREGRSNKQEGGRRAGEVKEKERQTAAWESPPKRLGN